jgi:hypothetical protein
MSHCLFSFVFGFLGKVIIIVLFCYKLTFFVLFHLLFTQKPVEVDDDRRDEENGRKNQAGAG